MELPGVSIVIPTFNRLEKVISAIDSVLGQSYPTEACDVIVVDDGSSDGTHEALVSRYGERIRVIGQRNSGPSAARNRGIDQARHDIVAFLDSDDKWMPQKLIRQVPSIMEPGVVLSYCDWRSAGRDPQCTRFAQIGLKLNSTVTILDYPLRTLLRESGSGVWTSTVLVRKDVLCRCGRFDERMRLCEDVRLWFRLAVEGKFSILSEQLVEKGQPGSDSLTQRTDSSYFLEYATGRLEIFWETYARASDAPRDVAGRLRRLIATSLYELSVFHASSRDYRRARRSAVEALTYLPPGLYAAKALCYACAPSLFAFAHRTRHSAKTAQHDKPTVRSTR